MAEDKVIQYGKEWLEIVRLLRGIERDAPADSINPTAQDLGAALIRMAYVRFEREYRAYWEEEMKMEEATRKIENEVAELLGLNQ